MQASLSWVPANTPTTTGQLVQYKKSSDTVWITASNLTPTDTYYNFSNQLTDNVSWDFKIVNVCSDGNTELPVVTKWKIGCPTTTYTATPTTITVSITQLGGDITYYKVDLLSQDGLKVVGTTTITDITTNPVTYQFTGLTDNTHYNIRVAPAISSTKTNICSQLL